MDVLVFSREDFISLAIKVSEKALFLYYKISDSIDPSATVKDYKCLGVKCYICLTNGHIATECK